MAELGLKREWLERSKELIEEAKAAKHRGSYDEAIRLSNLASGLADTVSGWNHLDELLNKRQLRIGA